MSKRRANKRATAARPPQKENDNDLPNPFCSPPMTLPRFYISFQTRRRPAESVTFAATYAAKRFVDGLLLREPFVWLDSYTIETNNVIIRCEPNLERIINHAYSALESAWQLPCPYDRWLERITDSY